MMDKLLRGILVLIVLLCPFAIMSRAYAEIITVTGRDSYTLGDGLNESIEMAKYIAKKKAMLNASQQAGVYVKSLSVVKISAMTQDEICAFASGLIKEQGEPRFKTEVLADNIIRYHCEITVQVDTSDITTQLIADRRDAIQQTLDLENVVRKKLREREELNARIAAATDPQKKEEMVKLAEENTKDFQAIKWLNAGLAFSSNKMYDSAIDAYNHAIALNPHFAYAYNNRACAYSRLNEKQKAVADFSKAIELKPEHAGFYNNRGQEYADMRAYSQAFMDYDKAIALDPSEAAYYYNRGVANENSRNWQQAIVDYEKAISLKPQYVHAHINMGNVYAKMRNYQMAISCYEKAIAMDPQNIIANSNRARAYARLGDDVKTADAYSKAIALNPKDADLYHNRAVAYTKLKKYQKALMDYNVVIELNPRHADAYTNRGLTYYFLAHYKKALADFDKAVALNPGDVRAQEYRRVVSDIVFAKTDPEVITE